MNVQPLTVQTLNPTQPTLATVVNTLADAKDSQHLRFTQADGFHVRSGFKITEALADLGHSSSLQARNHERQNATSQFKTLIMTQFPNQAPTALQQLGLTNATELTVGEVKQIQAKLTDLSHML